LLENSDYLADFNVRPVIGDSLPLYANLGISQVEQYLLSHKVQKIVDLVNRLSADGLIIHVNPLQEWFQPGGDILSQPPIETIRQLVETVNFPVIVKEVGQGMGPASLEALLKLPVAAVEFAAFGGTNFSQIELKRGEPGAREAYYPFIGVGEPAGDMVGYVNELLDGELTHSRCQFIVSGGIRDFLDGYYLIRRLRSKAVYGQASAFLRHAMAGYEELYQYVHQQVQGLLLANAYLTVK
jgi:isopentenyl-diphosphate delta-isomerase